MVHPTRSNTVKCVVSLSNKTDEQVTVIKAVVDAITEGWQIVPKKYYTEDLELLHHLRTNSHGRDVVLFCQKQPRQCCLSVELTEDVEGNVECVVWITHTTKLLQAIFFFLCVCCIVCPAPHIGRRW